ncbi:MAG: hypothetical protein LJE73_09715, partial [Proteobacteria bacterium]|nr:hypothetical protein [Pseudomonadota bacterium]
MPFLRVFTMLAFGISILFVASCSQNDDPGPPSTIPISNCIVNADKDIIIGDVDDGANPGCDWINIEETDTGGSYGEIIVEDGGLLTIGALRQPLASTPTAKNIILAGNSEPLEFESICITDGGTMRVGTPDRPITAENPEVIRFKGDKSTPGSEEPDCQNEGPDKNQSFRKG